MIAFVHGMAVDMTESSVVVEAGGIGYEIYMTGADLSEIRMGTHGKTNSLRCDRSLMKNARYNGTAHDCFPRI